jgi:hypothetical protein
MGVDANGQLKADMDGHSVDATGWGLEKQRKAGLNQAQVIGATLEHLRRGLDVVTVRDGDGNSWAVPAAASRALQRAAETRGHEAGLDAGFDIGWRAALTQGEQAAVT